MSASSDPAPATPDRPLPSGTITFAFTDIEGSTQRWERDRAAMQQAVRRHDALMRAAIVANAGRVFKTIGDAFCAAFSRPEDAVGAMLAAQRSLAAEDFGAIDGLRVRAAIHTGTADERDGDYFGPAVNRVARLLAIGHGGQVLLSGATADIAQSALESQASLRDLGEHRLKDLARPERVYQLVAPDLLAEFPPLRSLDALKNNLPRVLTTFVGREKELAEITALLEEHQLVTLVGSGGIGKTRASLQVAANLLDGSGDGVWFIELAPLASGDYVASAVAQAMGLGLASNGDPVENLARALESKHALLVFDNCEHLIEAAARVIATLLRACPKVKILASSRQSLGIAGEAAYRVPSLTVPDQVDATQLSAQDTARYAAMALFVERACAADNRFALTDDNAPTIADICRRLDGIPLAIELAAARVKILSPRQLRERLDERFRVLTGGNRDVLPRQQTLRALIDWSHDLLDERERTLFRRLGIFVNGFTLEGVVAVGSGTGLDEFDVLDVLASLVDKSLVLAEAEGDALRYRLLESTRVYAREKLEAAGERETCSARHLRYMRDRFVAARAHAEQTARLAELDEALRTELEDARVALDWAVNGQNAAVGGELLAAIGSRWGGGIALEREGLARLEAFATALRADDSALVSRLWSVTSVLAMNSGLTARAFAAATQAVVLARACGEPLTLAEALDAYAWGAMRSGKFDDAEAALSEAEAIPGGSTFFRLRLLQARSYLSHQRGDLETAVRANEQLREAHRTLGNAAAERIYALNLAELEHARGRTERAIALVRETLPAARANADRSTLANVLTNLAGYFAAVDDLPEARAAAREAILEFAARDAGGAGLAIAIQHLSLTLALGGDLTRAATLTGYGDAALRRHGFEREFTETKTRDRLNAVLSEGIAPPELGRLLAEGAALTPEAAVALALGALRPKV